jgi:hypothetical protein
MKKSLFVLSAAIVLLFTQCETIKNLPTNTSGGVFSLNGQWQLTSSSDNRNMEGTVVSVVPGFPDATVRTIPAANAYCVRERDAFWRSVKSDQNGGFVTEVMVNACTGSPTYKAATIAVISNNEIRIKTMTAANAEILQTWTRQSNSQ